MREKSGTRASSSERLVKNILLERERIKRKTIEHRRLHHRDAAA